MSEEYFSELTPLEMAIVLELIVQFGTNSFKVEDFRNIRSKCADMLGIENPQTSIRAKGYMNIAEHQLNPEAIEFLQGAYHERYNKSSTV